VATLNGLLAEIFEIALAEVKPACVPYAMRNHQNTPLRNFFSPHTARARWRWRPRGCVVRWGLVRGMHCFQEGDDCVDLRRGQVFAVGGHVAAALHDLADDLAGRQAGRGAVQGRTAQSTRAAQRMAVAALLGLDQDRAL
jgi:hypothetical protein